jgi:hypothetical protein
VSGRLRRASLHPVVPALIAAAGGAGVAAATSAGISAPQLVLWTLLGVVAGYSISGSV